MSFCDHPDSDAPFIRRLFRAQRASSTFCLQSLDICARAASF
jgi:hypothetical protein